VEKYKGTAVRSGDWWAVTVHDVPTNGPAVTQGKTREEAEDMTFEMMELLLGHRDFIVTLDFQDA
jgi:predicted RNase H-like HicB family nuclease